MTQAQAAPVAKSVQSAAAGVDFDLSFMRNSASVDLSRYATRNLIAAGNYVPDIFVNGMSVGSADVRFTAEADTPDAQACFDRALLVQVGVDVALLGLEKDGASTMCLRLDQLIPDAKATFDFAALRLDLSIPQASLLRHARDYVNPELWSQGVPMAMLDYYFDAYSNSRTGGTQLYGGLEGGFNLQGWRFRHQGSLALSQNGQSQYQNIATYVQRDIPTWSAQLVLGETYTSGDLFDSTSFRGVRLYSDDRMLPNSLRGYAPVIRGVANSNARVSITQNGVKLRELSVAPGAFEINDLYPTGYGGDLQVTITEADGAVRTFSVPYSAVPMALREGQSRYSVTAGTVRNLLNTKPFFSQATWQYGVNSMVTGYAGLTVAEGYRSGILGAVLNTSWGAFGLDATQAVTQIPNDQTYTGQSYRASYAKLFDQTGTNLSIATYRYSTNGYFGLNDAMAARDRTQQPGNWAMDPLYRQRSRASITLGQRTGDNGGNLYLTGSTVNYWDRPSSDLNFTVGYSNTYRNLSYSLSASRQRDAFGHSDTLFYASISIPLGEKSSSMLSANMSRDSSGRARMQSNLSGSLGEDRNIFYGLNVDYNRDSSGGAAQTNGGVNASYRAAYADLSASVSAGDDYQQFSVGARGAVVAHPGGVTLSRPLSETFAIVHAKDAEGAKINNAPGVRIDSRGYAVVPYLTPYSMNEVSIDPKGLTTDVELKQTSQRIAPRAGAVPLLVFETESGRSMVMRALQEDQKPVPFGAVVIDSTGKEVGQVGQAGKVLARGLDDEGKLWARWEKGGVETVCSLSYKLPEKAPAGDPLFLQVTELPCIASDDPVAEPIATDRASDLPRS
ncbi:fimbria/pilus outer membrane usher protein [Herminiimonas sp. KBW02]|uniref:fimbria/pilus outer membrane usher protein n=1 Tax=Herminiimonas sp. KBW02 TaxID=2153363 RepID=UPI001F21D0D6|nr:fimbria/pilus outer membrane usher protein [Herminiimonas sp. KBW02]